MTHIDTDVCVAGAGPAGLTLALLLVRSGVRVVVAERSAAPDRAFRGEILQPSGMMLLDQLGVLAAARARGCHELERFLLVDRGRVLIDGDYRELPGPYNRLLSIPQRHVLAELLAACEREPGFTYLPGAKVTDLLRDGARITGAVTGGRAGRHEIRAHCVVGADGRYSRVRRLAGIAADRISGFDQDVLWFKVPRDGDDVRDVRIFRAGGNPLLTYPSAPDSVQIGWTLPHRGYAALAREGPRAILDRITAAAPAYADRIAAHVHGAADLTLLDAFSARAAEWVRDGLVLIGDSAHTHSPIGAQGINLAIQDAVALHPVLAAAARTGPVGAASLAAFTARRRPEIDRMIRIQRMQSKAMFSAGRIASVVRPRAAAVISRTPLYARIFDRIAFGDPGIRVDAVSPGRTARPYGTPRSG